MPVYHALANALLTPEDAKNLLAESSKSMKAGPPGAAMSLAPLGVTTKFKPIGLGLPLTIQIRHVYTGRYPKTTFGSSSDMLLVSALKDFSIFDATPRAINFLRPKVKARSNVSSPSAVEQGTAIVAYSPAITASSLILTLELIFDDFDQDLFGKIGGALTSLAGIPVFAPAQGYLLVAGSLVKLAGDVGEALFDGEPDFSPTVSLDFDIPGSPVPVADFRIICNPGLDPSGLEFVVGRGLVGANGKVYDGDQPYIVLSLDGTERESLKKFTPTLAGAALLKKFYSMKDGAEAGIDLFLEAVKLFNDSKYRLEFDNLGDKIGALQGKPGREDDVKKLTERQDAIEKNILSDLLKPKDQPAAAKKEKAAPPALALSEGSEADRVKEPGDHAPPMKALRASPNAPSKAMKGWRVAQSLLALEKQLNVMAPHRSKASDGKIGDAKHASRSSDHNPWVDDNGVGVVTAMDVTNDPQGGCDANALAEAIRAAKDSRVKYVIWNKRICNYAAVGGAVPWAWRPYGGSNTHEKHVHISVRPEKLSYDSTDPWPMPA